MTVKQTIRDRALAEQLPDVTDALNREVVPTVKATRNEVNKILQGPAFVASASGVLTIDWNVAPAYALTLTESITSILIKDPALDRGFFTILIKQPAAFTVTGWPSNIQWASGTEPTITVIVGHTDVLRFFFDGTSYFGWVEGVVSSSGISGPAGGDLAGNYPNPTIALLAVTDAKTAAANKDGLAATPSMRTLGTGSQQATAGDDARLSDSRIPTGAAGGDLSQTYPNPNVAAIHETGANTQLTIGAIADGQTLVRSGTTVVGSAGAPPGGAAGGDLASTYPNPNVAAIHETGGPTKLTIGAIPDGDLVVRSGTTLIGTNTVSGIWLPDAAPLTPYADDNEFIDGSGTPSGWAVFDPLALGFTQAEITPTFLKCSVPYNATNRLLASYRAAPAPAEYSIWAKFSNTMAMGSAGGADDWDMSLVFMEGTTTLTKWAGISLSYNSSIVARTWATYDATPVNVGPTDPMYVQPVVYVRLGYDSTNFYFYISDDGIGWNKLGSVAKTFSPVKVGFAFTNSKNTGTKFAFFDFYRVITGAGSSGTDILANGRVTISALGVAPAGGSPTGAAGGDLSGTYPNPNVIAMLETSGPTHLALGAIADGQTLVRSGTTIVGSAGAPPGGAAGGDLASTYPNPNVAAIHETGGPTKLTIGTIADGQFVQRSGTSLIGAFVAGFPVLLSSSTSIPDNYSTVVSGIMQIADNVVLTLGDGSRFEVI